ncbi:hypothetical protein [Clavibacter sp. CFBP 8614]|uniref:hypothetical protein n=1 Tax=unclassified Clavibacter TaxID=2626594 RepID=UPI004042BE5B
MTRITSAPSRTRNDRGRIGRAHQHVAALAIAITTALAVVIGCSMPAQAAESHPASAAATAHVTAAEARAGAAITATAAAVTTSGGTSTTLTPTDPGVKDPHALGASAKSAGWDRHGPWVDISKDAWPIITASGGAGATVRFCAIAKIGPFLCFLGVIAIAAVTEWVKHHPPCPGDQKFKFYFGDTPSYCHD